MPSMSFALLISFQEMSRTADFWKSWATTISGSFCFSRASSTL